MDQRKALINIFMHYNNQINLSAIRDPEGIYIKHILDSIEVNKLNKLHPGTTLCDVGTGWWFPLLPLAMTHSDIQCTGIDSTRKKIDTINTMIKELNIPNAKAIWTRAEDHKETYDYVTARAVGYIDKLMPQLYHLAKRGWYIILYKQFTPEEEKMTELVCKKFKIRVNKKHIYQLFPEDIKRVIYVIKK